MSDPTNNRFYREKAPEPQLADQEADNIVFELRGSSHKINYHIVTIYRDGSVKFSTHAFGRLAPDVTINRIQSVLYDRENLIRALRNQVKELQDRLREAERLKSGVFP